MASSVAESIPISLKVRTSVQKKVQTLFFQPSNVHILHRVHTLKAMDTIGNYSIKTYLVTSNGWLLIV